MHLEKFRCTKYVRHSKVSVTRLCRWHKFSVQDGSDATVNADGSLTRWGTAITAADFNYSGHIQRIRKDKQFNDLNIKDTKADYILWYVNDSLRLETWTRVLFNINPRNKLTQVIIDAHTKLVPTIIIAKFVGYAEEVFHPRIKYKAALLESMQWFKDDA